MPRVQQKTKNRAGGARTCGRCGEEILAGERYFTWAFRYGGRRWHCHRHPPKRSELTQSKLADVYGAIEDAEDQLASTETVADIEALVAEVAERVREVAQEYEDAAEAFGNSGPNQEAADELGGFADELESWTPSEEDDDTEEDSGTSEEVLEAVRSEAQDALNECPL